VPALVARSLRPRSGRVIASEAEGIRGAPNRMRKTVCMGKCSTQSNLGGWGSLNDALRKARSPLLIDVFLGEGISERARTP
jgi:hypothetical protein